MREVDAAVVELARSRVKRALGQLRGAAADLAVLAGDAPEAVVGTARVQDPGELSDLDALVRVGLAKYGAVHVVVLATPGRTPQGPTTPTTAPPGA